MSMEALSDIIFIFKKSIKQFYDNFLYLLILNLFFITLIFLVVTFGVFNFYRGSYLITIILYFVFLFLLTLGEMIIYQYVSFRYIRIKKVFSFIKNNFKKLFLIFLFWFLGYSLLIVDIFYFFTQALGSNNLFLRYLFFLLVFISTYLFFMLTMVQFYLWGLLIYQKEKTVLTLIKRAAILTFDNLFFSFLMVLMIAVLTFISIFTGLGLIILIPNLLYIIIFNSTELILDKY